MEKNKYLTITFRILAIPSAIMLTVAFEYAALHFLGIINSI